MKSVYLRKQKKLRKKNGEKIKNGAQERRSNGAGLFLDGVRFSVSWETLGGDLKYLFHLSQP